MNMTQIATFKRVRRVEIISTDMEMILDISEGSYSFPEYKKFQGKSYMLSYGDNLFRVKISPEKDLPAGKYKLRSFKMQCVCWFGRFYSEPTIIDFSLA